MNQRRLLSVLVLCAATVAVLFLPRTVAQQSTIYNPYATSILPPDLVSEIARVRREVQVIYNQALTEWHALRLRL